MQNTRYGDAKFAIPEFYTAGKEPNWLPFTSPESR
jgi:hypothetical protein